MNNNRFEQQYLGFELFDIILVLSQFFFLFVGKEILPIFRAISCFLFVITLFFLAKTKEYSYGVKVLTEPYPYISFVMLSGATLTGGLLFMMGLSFPIFLALEKILGLTNDELLNHPIGIAVLLPVVFFSVIYIPWLYYKAYYHRLSKPQKNLTKLGYYVSRIIILITANFFLLFFYDAFPPTPGSEIIISFLAIVILLAVFYMPIRIQEMFLVPEGSHLRSFLQTAMLVTLFHLAIPFFS